MREDAGPDWAKVFDAPQVHTDDNGRHWDDQGREYRLVEVDGEADFVPLAPAELFVASLLADAAEKWQVRTLRPGSAAFDAAVTRMERYNRSGWDACTHAAGSDTFVIWDGRRRLLDCLAFGCYHRQRAATDVCDCCLRPWSNRPQAGVGVLGPLLALSMLLCDECAGGAS